MKKLKGISMFFLTFIAFFCSSTQIILAEDVIKEILSPIHGQGLDEERLFSILEGRPVIFLGEVHSNPTHHMVHERILKALVSRYGVVNLAMEALPRKAQAIIDRFVEGKIPEAEFLKQVQWDHVWGFDYGLYRPVVDLVISSNGRVWGIGADLDAIKRIARSGMQDLKEDLISPLGVYPGPSSYRDSVKATYEALGQHRQIGPFEHFFLAQLARDELMAENLKNAFLADPKRTVVIAGNQHIVNYWGIPFRFLRRLGLPIATLVVYSDSQREVLRPYLNEFLWITR